MSSGPAASRPDRTRAAGRVADRIPRGTTNTNRLRRVDRWIAHLPALRRAEDPLVVDLGYGASAVTTLELHERLARIRPDVEVIGLEIDPARVERARAQLEEVRAGRTPFSPRARVSFAAGGFDVPLPADRRPAVIRAMNVLRQYVEADVGSAWRQMADRLAPAGVLVEGTCDELGRICAWADIGHDAAARTLTISLRLAGLAEPGAKGPAVVAERLPKALIHRNVPGEPIHEFLVAVDREWSRAAGAAPFGPVQRWLATLDALAAAGWPLAGRARRRLGEVTVPWETIAPL